MEINLNVWRGELKVEVGLFKRDESDKGPYPDCFLEVERGPDTVNLWFNRPEEVTMMVYKLYEMGHHMRDLGPRPEEKP